jgi:RimJ/RimL family protein N-acetyltransferase
MNGKTLIETERLRLRSWRRGDAKDFERYCNTPKVMRWLGGVQTRAQLLDDVNYFIRSERRDGVTFWVIERFDDDAFLGFCGLIRIPKGECPVAGELEIGWRLRSDVWRQGYAFEAATAVLICAFEQLGAQRVLSRAAAGNNASQGLMEKLGMKRWPDLDYFDPWAEQVLKAYRVCAPASP